ncbi:MAG: hypothetical protein EA345_12665 [Halomonas sp.]|nr:PilX N-terminal domain-containing pilus assembly protein [Halomonas sp.]TVP46401.1 MAG: hypothetical protein EA345_12665 [Halomonas sp.]
MKHQQGAALVIVMVLLTGALMLGMSGMQSALLSERLAGNYRASVQAQMNAESMMSIFSSMVSQRGLEEIFKGTYHENDFLNELSGVEGIKSIDTWDITFDVRGDELTVTTRDRGSNNSADGKVVAVYQRAGAASGTEEEGAFRTDG